jgi:hypothetical protein
MWFISCLPVPKTSLLLAHLFSSTLGTLDKAQNTTDPRNFAFGLLLHIEAPKPPSVESQIQSTPSIHEGTHS